MLRPYLALSEAKEFLVSRVHDDVTPSKQLTKLSELIRRLDQELSKPFNVAADTKVERELTAAITQLLTTLHAEERKKAATDDVPFSLVQPGKSAGSRGGKGRKKQ